MVVVVVVVVVLRCVAADSKGETEEGILEKYKKRKLQPQRQQQQRQQLTAVAIAGMGPIVQKLFNLMFFISTRPHVSFMFPARQVKSYRVLYCMYSFIDYTVYGQLIIII